MQKIIDRFCLDCYDGNIEEVETCPDNNCLFHKSNDYDELVPMGRIIREHCNICIGEDELNAENCLEYKCALYPHRSTN